MKVFEIEWKTSTDVSDIETKVETHNCYRNSFAEAMRKVRALTGGEADPGVEPVDKPTTEPVVKQGPLIDPPTVYECEVEVTSPVETYLAFLNGEIKAKRIALKYGTLPLFDERQAS